MHTRNEMARQLNRSVLILQGLQSRFGLPVSGNDSYSDAYFVFLRKIVHLRIMGVPEADLDKLWELEKKFLQAIHVDSSASETWFLDRCCESGQSNRRLMLSNYNMGVPLSSMEVQLGLDLAGAMPELFSTSEMGDDVIRIFCDYLKVRRKIIQKATAEIPMFQEAARWIRRFSP